jgi:hypothetical protein
MSDLTAAPMFVKDSDGTEYTLSVLSDRDRDAINNWVRAGMVQVAQSALRDDMTQAERDELLGAAMRESSKVDFATPEGSRHIRNLNGVARVLFQSLLHCHPKTTYDDCRKLLRDESFITQFMTQFNGVVGLRMRTASEKNGESPN